MSKYYEISPFVKWVGGKRQLLNRLTLLFPNDTIRVIEPFVGGGSFFMHCQSDENVINDLNHELIISYKVIKNYPEKLILELEKHEKEHNETHL